MTTPKILFFFAALSAATSPGFGASLTGHWLHEDTTPDGNTTQIVLILNQNGSDLSGKVVMPWGELRIQKGSATGNALHLTVMTPADSTKPAVYDGKLVGGKLQVDSHWPGDNNSHLDFRRAGDQVGLPPARLPLPSLHEVPSNGLTVSPPMGWNSWNYFQGKVDDATIRAAADTIVENGMKEAGYVYVNIDDTWEGKRDEEGNIHPNSKFPDMKALSDYVHGKGLKLGIYSSPGPKTCGGYEGSYGHEEQDARTYASWGIDYLKYDWCSAGRIYGNTDLRAVYQKMGDALHDSGRPIVYSLCEYGMGDVWKWGQLVGANLWRTTGDITDAWSALSYAGFSQNDLWSYAGPGHWNDPDMLEVGNGGMTETEYRTHMSLWAILAAPLLAGNDLRHMTEATREILLSRDVIAVDQDPAAHQGKRLSKDGDLEVWAKSLADGSQAVGLFNRGKAATDMKVRWSELGLSGTRTVRDLWAHTTQTVPEEYSASVPGHGVAFIRVSR